MFVAKLLLHNAVREMNKKIILKSFTNTYRPYFYIASAIMIVISTIAAHFICLPRFSSLQLFLMIFLKKKKGYASSLKQLKGAGLVLISNTMFTSKVLKNVFFFFFGQLSSLSFPLWNCEIKVYKPH